MTVKYSGLCVFGPMDGELIVSDKDYYEVADMPKPPTYRELSLKSGSKEEPIAVNKVTYLFRTGYHTDDFKLDFFIPSGRTLAEAMVHVLQHYSDTVRGRKKK